MQTIVQPLYLTANPAAIGIGAFTELPIYPIDLPRDVADIAAYPPVHVRLAYLATDMFQHPIQMLNMTFKLIMTVAGIGRAFIIVAVICQRTAATECHS